MKEISAIILLAVLVSGCGFPRCDEKSRAVVMARSLSTERLEVLYEDMRIHRRKLESEGDEKPRLREYNSITGNIPDEFSDLNPKKVRPTGSDPNIMLEGCFDEFVYLFFNGIGENQRAGDSIPGIILVYTGSPEHGEVLWKPKARDRANE
ncbi:MAG: hypothetical protein SFY80_16755 [Verrucomicrobiota bacterium]|nr:hypothetical protein [Verrucomicrobiota bacterium]